MIKAGAETWREDKACDGGRHLRGSKQPNESACLPSVRQQTGRIYLDFRLMWVQFKTLPYHSPVSHVSLGLGLQMCARQYVSV